MAAGETCGLPKMGHDPGGVVRRAKERLMVDGWLQGYSTLFHNVQLRKHTPTPKWVSRLRLWILDLTTSHNQQPATRQDSDYSGLFRPGTGYKEKKAEFPRWGPPRTWYRILPPP